MLIKRFAAFISSESINKPWNLHAHTETGTVIYMQATLTANNASIFECYHELFSKIYTEKPSKILGAAVKSNWAFG